MTTENRPKIIPVGEFAKSLGVTRQTVINWKDEGRKSRRGKLRHLKMIWMTYGWGVTQQAYNEFIESLNDE